MHYNVFENATSNNCLGTISYADVSAVADSTTDITALEGLEGNVLSWDSASITTDYISGGYIEPVSWAIRQSTPSREEFETLVAKVKELEDILNRLWQAKAVGDLL